MAVDLSEFRLEAVIGSPNTAQLAADLAKYGPDAYVRIYRHGRKYALQVCNESGDGGDPHDDSHDCPGSPGC